MHQAHSRNRPGQGWWARGSSGTQAPGVEVAGIDIAELVRKSQVTEEALRGVMTTGEGAAAFTRFLQGRGHTEVVGMIGSGGVSLFATIRVSCCYSQCKEHAGVGWTEGWRQKEKGEGRGRDEVWAGATAAAVCG